MYMHISLSLCTYMCINIYIYIYICIYPSLSLYIYIYKHAVSVRFLPKLRELCTGVPRIIGGGCSQLNSIQLDFPETILRG